MEWFQSIFNNLRIFRKKIIILGATSPLGLKILEYLVEHNTKYHKIVAIVFTDDLAAEGPRNRSSKETRLLSLKAVQVKKIFSYSVNGIGRICSKASVVLACPKPTKEGVDSIASILKVPILVQKQPNIILLSSIEAEIKSCANHRNWKYLEQYLTFVYRSYVIIRMSLISDDIAMFLKYLKYQDTIISFFPGDVPILSISTNDISRACSELIRYPDGHQRKTYILTSSAPYTLDELVAWLTEYLGRAVSYASLSSKEIEDGITTMKKHHGIIYSNLELCLYARSASSRAESANYLCPKGYENKNDFKEIVGESAISTTDWVQRYFDSKVQSRYMNPMVSVLLAMSSFSYLSMSLIDLFLADTDKNWKIYIYVEDKILPEVDHDVHIVDDYNSRDDLAIDFVVLMLSNLKYISADSENEPKISSEWMFTLCKKARAGIVILSRWLNMNFPLDQEPLHELESELKAIDHAGTCVVRIPLLMEDFIYLGILPLSNEKREMWTLYSLDTFVFVISMMEVVNYLLKVMQSFSVFTGRSLNICNGGYSLDDIIAMILKSINCSREDVRIRQVTDDHLQQYLAKSATDGCNYFWSHSEIWSLIGLFANMSSFQEGVDMTTIPKSFDSWLEENKL